MPGLLKVIASRQEKAAFDKPLSLDVRFGNLCNLQCQICNPHNSTQIERDTVLSKWNAAAYHRLAQSRFTTEAEWYESPMFEDELADLTTDLRYITLGGGEPSISKPAIKWLERLIESGQAKEIEIHISTNVTNVNPRFFDLASQFFRAQLYLSIDGFGPLNEYLRYPSKWRIVERNVDYIRKLVELGNVEINVTPVISAYNALSVVHLFEWADSQDFGIYAFPVRGVDQIDCALIPEDARKLVVQRLRDFVKSAKNPKSSYDSIGELCTYLELPVDPAFAASCRDKFHAFTHEIDDHRGMRFEIYSPEMAGFLGYSSGSNSYGSAEVSLVAEGRR
jgi:MoaA/NifB/PqqE/SkfB family radical SAM enzyme